MVLGRNSSRGGGGGGVRVIEKACFFFFFIKHLYPGYPTRLEAVTNVGSCTTYLVTQTMGL